MADTHSSLVVYQSLGNKKIKWCLVNFVVVVSLPSVQVGKKEANAELWKVCSGDIWFTLSPAEFCHECVCCKGILLYLNVHCLGQNTRTRSLHSLNDWICVCCVHVFGWVCVDWMCVVYMCWCVWFGCVLRTCVWCVCVCVMDSSVVSAPDSWSKCRGFESLLERWENFLLHGQLSVLTYFSICSTPVLPQ